MPEEGVVTVAEKLTDVITGIGSVLDGGVDWMGSITTFISTDPIAFLFCVGFVGAGFGAGLLGRVFGTR